MNGAGETITVCKWIHGRIWWFVLIHLALFHFYHVNTVNNSNGFTVVTVP